MNKLSLLDMIAFDGSSGAGTTSSSETISFPSGGRKYPVKPGHPYEAASVSRCFDFELFPFCRTFLNFGARGCEECRNTYPSSNPRALQRSSSFVHFAIVGVLQVLRFSEIFIRKRQGK